MKPARGEAAVARLHELVENASALVPFTGAGISTESGIPDFRSPGGIWTRNAPIDFRDFVASAEMRAEAWRRRFAMEDHFARAVPTRGHRALASWVRSGRSPGVITQNIDNLHQDAGVPDAQVVELHGNTRYARCLRCGERYEIADLRAAWEADGAVPDCRCGGFIKTATVSFGQAMPEAAMQHAEALTFAADLFIAIGSSLVVWPAAGFPSLAKRNGARLVIINREPTELDDMADLVIHDDIGTILERFITPPN